MPKITELAAAGNWRRLGPDDAAEAIEVIKADPTLKCDVTIDDVAVELANAVDGINFELWDGGGGRKIVWAYRWAADRTKSSRPATIIRLSVAGMPWPAGLGIWQLRLQETAKKIRQTDWLTVFFDRTAKGDARDCYRYTAAKALSGWKGEQHHKVDEGSVRFIFKVK